MAAVDILQAQLKDDGAPFLSGADLGRAHIVFEDDENLPFDEWWHLAFTNGNAPLRLNDLARDATRSLYPCRVIHRQCIPCSVAPPFDAPVTNPFSSIVSGGAYFVSMV